MRDAVPKPKRGSEIDRLRDDGARYETRHGRPPRVLCHDPYHERGRDDRGEHAEPHPCRDPRVERQESAGRETREEPVPIHDRRADAEREADRTDEIEERDGPCERQEFCDERETSGEWNACEQRPERCDDEDCDHETDRDRHERGREVRKRVAFILPGEHGQELVHRNGADDGCEPWPESWPRTSGQKRRDGHISMPKRRKNPCPSVWNNAEKMPTPENESIRISMMRRNGPCVSRTYRNRAYCGAEKTASSAFEPSSGGMGIRLKIARFTLMMAAKNRNWTRRFSSPSEGYTALITFDAGPAIPTRTDPTRGFLREAGLYGTGRAYPNPAMRSMRKPTGSRCAKGFRVSRPMRSAVRSPSQFAMRACENSWTESATMIPRMSAAKRRGWEKRRERSMGEECLSA